MTARRPDRRQEIREILRGRLVRGLRAGSLQAGDRLPSAHDLEIDFDVDHRLILDAYRQLAIEGLVEIRRRGGVYVRNFAPGHLPVSSDGWIVDVLALAIARDLSVPGALEWLTRSTETLRLKALAVQSTSDQIEGMCRELNEEYALDSHGLDSARLEQSLTDGVLLAEVQRADLLVTTAACERLVRLAGLTHGKPVIVAAVRPDLIGGEWRLLLRRPVYVVVADPRYADFLRRFFTDVENSANLHILIAGRDDVTGIPGDAPTYVTRGARTVLGSVPVSGRVLPPARIFSSETARELLSFIVTANLGAVARRTK